MEEEFSVRLPGLARVCFTCSLCDPSSRGALAVSRGAGGTHCNSGGGGDRLPEPRRAEGTVRLGSGELGVRVGKSCLAGGRTGGSGAGRRGSPLRPVSEVPGAGGGGGQVRMHPHPRCVAGVPYHCVFGACRRGSVPVSNAGRRTGSCQ